MSDETYSLVMIVSALAYAAVLWLRARQGRILKRILRSLTPEQRDALEKSMRDDESSRQ